ncbi:unnamed protein product, partial [Arctogadus glacialis]
MFSRAQPVSGFECQLPGKKGGPSGVWEGHSLNGSCQETSANKLGGPQAETSSSPGCSVSLSRQLYPKQLSGN